MNYDFVGIGDVVVDTFIELEQAHVTDGPTGKILSMKFGEKIPFGLSTYVPGVGNSANACVCAARLGLTTAFFGIIGDDKEGTDCLDVLKKETITPYITYSDNPTNHHFVLSFQAERTILVHHHAYKYTELLDSLPSLSIKTLYLSSISEQAEVIYPQIINYKKKNPQTRLVFQPGTYQLKHAHDPMLKEIFNLSQVLILNKEEAELITQLPHNTDIKKLFSGLHSFGSRTVIITDGPAGAYLSSGAQVSFCPMYPDIAPPKERTGAGDAFTATFASYLTLGYTEIDALIRAPINSMSVVQQTGAQKGLLSKEEIEQYLMSAPIDYKTLEI